MRRHGSTIGTRRDRAFRRAGYGHIRGIRHIPHETVTVEILENMAIDAVSQLAHGLQTMNQREGCRTTDRILAKIRIHGQRPWY